MNPRHSLLVALALALPLAATACVGPSPLRRNLDEVYNQTYVDEPVICAVAMPLFEVGLLGAGALDWVFVNPVYFWKDVMRGQGTPHYFQNPTVTVDDEP